ncbi:site-specific DNA-methyltransferase [Aliarcobacter butzleri]|uniref:site-specific DNA-methyltransferase n=1 Tax=Aliarcobacter butzleri TaxID=28197 RepID=UPI003BAE21D3
MKKNVIEEQSINDNNYKKLKELFPHAVSINESGKYVIDKEKLQMSLDPSLAEIKEDGYGLNWVGKKEAYYNAFTKNYKVLKPLKNESKNWDKTENILIKGDNLDALKILRQNYFESIKMIYIDPPYNTKNDGFIYNDNFTTSTERTLEELGYDKEYIDYIENIQGAKTHSGWLSFMYPRLLLAHDLLKDEGVIFISIDDNEVAQLRLLCDEIFGGENFIVNITREAIKGGSLSQYLRITHDNIIVYGKNIDTINFSGYEKEELILDQEDENGPFCKGRELNKWGAGSRREDSPSMWYSIPGPNGEEVFPIRNDGSEGRWRLGKKKMFELVNEKNIQFEKRKNGTYIAYEKIRDMKTGTKQFISIFKDNYINAKGTERIKKLFSIERSYFDYAKPIELMYDLMIMADINDNDCVLDFFAGSGSTADSLMLYNMNNNKKAFFINVQWAEKTPEKSEAKKAGYETIFDITKARIDKAGDQIAKGDIGFRTFEIVEDQKQKIYQKSLEDVSQEDLLVMMEKPDISSNEEILYNLFVAEALPLSTKHEELIKDKLYLASNVAFILGDITSDELVEALKDKKECEYITVYSPNISNDKFTLEIESNISKLGIKSDKLRFRG